jgi:hypothetical protein
MQRFTLFLTFLLLLTACAAPKPGLPDTPQADSSPVPVQPTAAPSTPATFENSLLAVEWMGRSQGNVLFPLDPATGNALPGYAPIPFGQSYFYAFSPDRSTLAALIFQDDTTYNSHLLLIDLPAWKTQRFELDLRGWVNAMVFSPNGEQLAIAHGEASYRLTIFDIKRGIITALEKTTSFVTRLKFTADGKSLMLYSPGFQNFATQSTTLGGIPPQAILLDARDLSPLWSADLKSVRDGIFPIDKKSTIDPYQPGNAMYLSPALVFAPDRDALYVIHADSEQLTTVDFGTRKVETVEIQTKLSWFEQLLSLDASVAHAKVADGTTKHAVVSPDGQFLYVVGVHNESFQDELGNLQMSRTPLGVEIIHTRDGSRILHIESDAADLSLSPDGRFLYLHNWEENNPWTDVFDTASRQITARKTGIYGSPALRINGESLVVSTYSSSETSHHMSIFQSDVSSPLLEWTGPHYIAWLTP